MTVQGFLNLYIKCKGSGKYVCKSNNCTSTKLIIYNYLFFSLQISAYNNNELLHAQTESNHDTALTMACVGGHTELVRLLLSRGASIEHKDKKGKIYFILS